MTSRLQTVLAHLQPDSLTGNNMNKEEEEKPLPSFDELPKFRNFVGCAWDVWGPNDQLGTINLLTEGVVKRAAQEEVRWVLLFILVFSSFFPRVLQCRARVWSWSGGSVQEINGGDK